MKKYYWKDSYEYTRIQEILRDYWLTEPDEDEARVTLYFRKGTEEQEKVIVWRNPNKQKKDGLDHSFSGLQSVREFMEKNDEEIDPFDFDIEEQYHALNHWAQKMAADQKEMLEKLQDFLREDEVRTAYKQAAELMKLLADYRSSARRFLDEDGVSVYPIKSTSCRNVYDEVERWMDCFHTTDCEQTINAAMEIISIMGELIQGCGAYHHYYSSKPIKEMSLSVLNPSVPNKERINDLNELIVFYLRIKNLLNCKENASEKKYKN